MNEAGTILIVDDDVDIREALSEVLRDEGFVVGSVANGLEAMSWLQHRETKPRLILLDLMMPVMDGWSFLRARKDDGALAKIPVVVMTAGYGCKDLTESGQINRCLSKPIDLSKLLAAIEACI